jgi:stalled ribosome rescue protein Dom34
MTSRAVVGAEDHDVVTAAAAAGSSIRLKGRNLTESEHIKLGAYHTLELEPSRAFTIHKVGRQQPALLVGGPQHQKACRKFHKHL